MNTQLGHLPAKAQLPKAQQSSILSPDFESIAWYAAISEICSHAKESIAFCCGKNRPSGEPFKWLAWGETTTMSEMRPAAGKVSGTNREVEAVVAASFAARTAASSFRM